jgi:hypothetical protein
MYCPSCGLQQTQDLRYCPRCGANLNPPAEREKPPNLVGPIWAVSLALTLVTLAGLGFVFAFAMVLIGKGIALTGGLFLLILLFLLVVLTIASLLVRQLSRLLNLYYGPGEAQAGRQEEAKKNELTGREAPRLEAMSEPPPSVTENTTRTFEPVPKGRQTKQNIP